MSLTLVSLAMSSSVYSNVSSFFASSITAAISSCFFLATICFSAPFFTEYPNTQIPITPIVVSAVGIHAFTKFLIVLKDIITFPPLCSSHMFYS